MNDPVYSADHAPYLTPVAFCYVVYDETHPEVSNAHDSIDIVFKRVVLY